MEPNVLMTSPFFSEIPVLKASELHNISEAFATELVRQLDRFNAEHPEAIMSTESSAPTNIKVPQDNFKALLDLHLPTPLDFYRAFQQTFCRYAASRYIIIPG